MYETLSAALTGLSQEGYTRDFNIAFDHLHCAQDGSCLNPNGFVIDKFYRFDDDTDPGEQSAVYAISSTDGSIKGVLVNAYGIYAGDVSDDLLRKLAVHQS
jgi:hypothetical protein